MVTICPLYQMSQQTQQQQRGPQRMVTVKGVLPPNEEELDFTEVHSIIEAREGPSALCPRPAR